MRGINSVRNLQILYYSKKNKENKKLKKSRKKSGPAPPFMCTTHDKNLNILRMKGAFKMK